MGKFLLLCLGKRDGGTPSYGEDGENGPFFLEDFYKGASVLLSRFFRVGMKGETLRQRARNLIAIAHPDFRAPLIEEFEKRFHCAF